jgi:site-specific DNA recombinase
VPPAAAHPEDVRSVRNRSRGFFPDSAGPRTGAGWTLRTVAAILANPRYTGRQVWIRQRTHFDLADPANTALGHKQVQRWNLPEGWVISRHPAHAALVGEADFIAAQDVTATRGPAGPAVRRYLLAGLLACGRCGRRLESAWSNGKPAYRCRHGHTSAIPSSTGQQKTPLSSKPYRNRRHENLASKKTQLSLL